MEIPKQDHYTYLCMYHVIRAPRSRYRILVNGVDEYLKVKMDEVRKKYPEIELIERRIKPDHEHVVICFPPKCSPAKLVQIIKLNTGALREKFAFIQEIEDLGQAKLSLIRNPRTRARGCLMHFMKCQNNFNGSVDLRLPQPFRR